MTELYSAHYPGVVAEVHYTRPDGLPTYATGMLTTEHPASSRGLPVWVLMYSYRTTYTLERGVPYGPADLPDGYVMIICPDDYRTDPACLPVAAESAGYRWELAQH